MDAMTIPNHDGYLLAGSSHEVDEFEPSDKQIAARAAYLKPLLIEKHPNQSEMLTDDLIGRPQFARLIDAAILDKDQAEVGRLMFAIRDLAIEAKAEQLAEDELWRDTSYEDDRLLSAIRASDVWEWLREYES